MPPFTVMGVVSGREGNWEVRRKMGDIGDVWTLMGSKLNGRVV